MAEPGETSALSNERFGFTLFVSICFHVVLILGVGFGVYETASPSSSLDITLAQYRSEEAPEEADFLAQENQSGSGSEEEKAAPSTPFRAPFADDEINEASPVAQEQAPPPREIPRDSVLAAEADARESAPRQPEEETPPEEDSGEETLSEEALSETAASLRAQLDLQRQAYAQRPRKRTISSASTKKDRDALYLDAWRKKIEAVGNRNYPEQASREGLYGTLRMLVALSPDGGVREVRILSSSGHRVLDDAAIRIVRQAAPFEPFPEDMKREVDVLEIVRTWQFHRGDSLSSY